MRFPGFYLSETVTDPFLVNRRPPAVWRRCDPGPLAVPEVRWHPSTRR
ncbi:MAG: hypothetical protein ABEJ68_07095 [Halobacteriaceae archaeon]